MNYQISDTCIALGKVILKPNISFSFLSYLLQGEKNVLIDTVPEKTSEQFMDDLSAYTPIEKLDALILNHSEEDHSGAVGKLLEAKPDLPIFCTEACKGRLSAFYPNANFNTVADGETLRIGSFDFRFFHTPGLHWDDNMVTFFESEKILFSNDLFGQYTGCEPPIDEPYSKEQILSATSGYYEKVFSAATVADRQAAFLVTKLPMQIIAPGHGAVLQKYISDVLKYYQTKLSQ